MTQTPTVGRIVHYHSYGTPGGEFLPEARAAVITAVPDPIDAASGLVSLAVLNPSGMFFQPEVEYAEEPSPGRWTWPPRA